MTLLNSKRKKRSSPSHTKIASILSGNGICEAHNDKKETRTVFCTSQFQQNYQKFNKALTSQSLCVLALLKTMSLELRIIFGINLGGGHYVPFKLKKTTENSFVSCYFILMVIKTSYQLRK